MKKTILFVVMLTLVAFVSGAIAQAPAKPAPASTAPAKAKMDKFMGEIKSVDAMAKSIVVAGRGKAGEKTFVVTADTKIMKDKGALKFEDLKAGAHVHIEYTKEMDKNTAATIKAFAPKAHPSEK
jgi:outer membrane lipoprotein-sorting protein